MLIFGIPVIWVIISIGAAIAAIVGKVYWNFRKRPIDHTSTLSETWRSSPNEDFWR